MTTTPSLTRQTTQVVDRLALTPMFRDLDDDLLRGIASSATIRRFPPRAMMFIEGDPGDPLYILLDGSVKVFVTSRQGDERVLATLGRNDTLGLVSFLDQGNRSASAASLEDVTTIALARSTLRQLIHVPEIGDAFLQGAANLIRRLTSQSADLVFLDLEGRVAKLLLAMAHQRSVGDRDELAFDLTFTQSDLAHMVGGSRQSVNQVLRAFERRGFLIVRGRHVEISDVIGLRHRANLE